ncbi:hypothetical protein F2Q69_00009830 [Brassica cretica]|uniref:Uncharacterized protein n=1 Tax=Brassica cretica TaxID=69181 RepID=A0A8S9NUE3_BRACR|nr:hypothetical protein F2Q69_00009830 [Brassica cretica]
MPASFLRAGYGPRSPWSLHFLKVVDERLSSDRVPHPAAGRRSEYQLHFFFLGTGCGPRSVLVAPILERCRRGVGLEWVPNHAARGRAAFVSSGAGVRPVPRPASGDDELSCYQKAPVEEKEKIAAKPALEEHVPGALCGLIRDQNKAKEEGELEEALVVHKELLETLIEQGGFIRSFSCDLLIQPFVCVQFNLVEHLRFVKGLQHFVFEPGGSLSVHRSIKNTLVKIAAALKLDFEGSLHKQEEPMVVSADYKLRSRARKSMIKACVWKSMIKACVWYQCREAQSKAIGSELNKEQKLLSLSDVCNEIHLRHEKGLQHYVFKPGEDMFVCKDRNKLVVKRARSLELIDQGYVILQGLDLRTNPFKGRGNGATCISFKLKSWTSIHVPERQGVTTRPNWLIGELVGLIHEVLDRKKAMGLDEAFIKIGMTMGHHGRLVFNLINQEMDGMKLVGQEMKWVIWYD